PLSALEKSCGSLRSTSNSIEPTSLQAIWLKHLSGTLVNKLTLLERCGARPWPACEDFWCAQPQASLHLRLSLTGRSNTKADFLTCDTSLHASYWRAIHRTPSPFTGSHCHCLPAVPLFPLGIIFCVFTMF